MAYNPLLRKESSDPVAISSSRQSILSAQAKYFIRTRKHPTHLMLSSPIRTIPRSFSFRNQSILSALEIKHVGNRPFMWGFLTIALGTVYVQTKFTDEMRANSDYWQTFHGSGKPKAH